MTNYTKYFSFFIVATKMFFSFFVYLFIKKIYCLEFLFTIGVAYHYILDVLYAMSLWRLVQLRYIWSTSFLLLLFAYILSFSFCISFHLRSAIKQVFGFIIFAMMLSVVFVVQFTEFWLCLICCLIFFL